LKKAESEEGRGGKLTLGELGIDNVGREVMELTDDQVLEMIESVFLEVARQILDKNGLNYVIPSRANSNQLYVAELDRIVLKNAMTNRSLANVGTVRKTAITTRILQLVHEVVGKHIHITKRDLFYTDVKLFEKQTESDNVIDDIACMIGCTRNSLNGRSQIGDPERGRERDRFFARFEANIYLFLNYKWSQAKRA
jgi:meiotic recombination protein SPO11